MTKIPNLCCLALRLTSCQGEGCYCSQGARRKLVSSGTTAVNLVSVIDCWDLGFVWCLVLGAWNLKSPNYMNDFALTPVDPSLDKTLGSERVQ